MGSVVVGVDGSPESERALIWALRHAKERASPVIAVTGFVVPWTIFLAPTYQESDYSDDARAMLEESVQRAQAEVPGVEVGTKVLPERPSTALIHAARGADLLVVGARGHGALPDVHIGSVANACINHAPCPVLVYRDATTAVGTEAG